MSHFVQYFWLHEVFILHLLSLSRWPSHRSLAMCACRSWCQSLFPSHFSFRLISKKSDYILCEGHLSHSYGWSGTNIWAGLCGLIDVSWRGAVVGVGTKDVKIHTEIHTYTFSRKKEDFKYGLPAFRSYYTASELTKLFIFDLSSLLQCMGRPVVDRSGARDFDSSFFPKYSSR